MDDIEMEETATDIDVIDIIDNSDPTIIYEEAERTDESDESITVSGSAIGTGNLLGQVFKLIASFREKEYWELNDKEVKSLNTTCPKVIPEIISKHKSLISCVLSLLGIIMKRVKRERLDAQLEQQDSFNSAIPESGGKTEIPHNNDEIKQTGLTGGRST